MKFPTSVSVLLSALAGVLAVAMTTLTLSHTAKDLFVLGLVFLAGLGIHPQGAAATSTPEVAPPFGLEPIVPAGQPAPATSATPAERSLP